MTSIVLLAIIVFIYFDLSVFKKQDASLFDRIFSDTPARICLRGMVFICFMILGLIVVGKIERTLPWDDYLSAFFMVIIFPFYLVKRYRFKKIFQPLSSLAQSINKDLALASDAFGVMLLWFLGMIGGILIFKGVLAAFPHLKSGLGEVLVVAAFSFILMIALIYRMMQKYPGLSFMKVVGLRRNNQSWGKLVVLPVLIGLILAAVSSLIIFSRAYQPTTPLSQIIDSTTSSWVFLAFIVMAVLMAPFFEEIIFRGFFYYIISKFRGQTFAVCFIAIVFGVMHFEQYWGDWAAIAMVMFLGFVLTVLRAWTGSSLPSIVTHYAYNGAMTIIPVIMILLSNPVYFEYQVRYAQLDSTAREELLMKSIHQYPEHEDSYNDLAWLYAQEERNLEQALRLIEEALVLSPDQFAYLDTKAEVLYKMGRLEEAIRLGQELVEQYPSNEYAKEQLEKFRKGQ